MTKPRSMDRPLLPRHSMVDVSSRVRQVRLRRVYTADDATAVRAADFGAAAIIASLDPADWQISQDVAEACRALVVDYHDADVADDRIAVTIDIVQTHVIVGVTGRGGCSGQVHVKPRRPFRRAG